MKLGHFRRSRKDRSPAHAGSDRLGIVYRGSKNSPRSLRVQPCSARCSEKVRCSVDILSASAWLRVRYSETCNPRDWRRQDVYALKKQLVSPLKSAVIFVEKTEFQSYICLRSKQKNYIAPASPQSMPLNPVSNYIISSSSRIAERHTRPGAPGDQSKDSQPEPDRRNYEQLWNKALGFIGLAEDFASQLSYNPILESVLRP